jgi:hypothetical protein
MLGPFTALSVDSSLVQFVDFSTKIVSKGHRIFRSKGGSLPENDEIESAAKSLRAMIRNLNNSLASTGASSEEQALRKLCDECVEVAEELISELEKLKIPGDCRNRKRESLRQALKSLWSVEKLESVEKRLEDLDGQLKLHILILLRYIITYSLHIYRYLRNLAQASHRSQVEA